MNQTKQTLSTLLSSQTLWSFVVACAAATAGVPIELCMTFLGAFGLKESAKHYSGAKIGPF